MPRPVPERIREMHRHYQAGHSLFAVGEYYGISANAVSLNFLRYDLPRRSQATTPAPAPLVGMSPEEIGSRQLLLAIHDYLKRHHAEAA
jgi:hypothetical protein